MRLVNFMEEAVGNTLEELMVDPLYRSTKLDEKARLDIIAYALNHLPPRYVVTEKGALYTRADELRQQFKTDIIIELSKAIKHVKANPR